MARMKINSQIETALLAQARSGLRSLFSKRADERRALARVEDFDIPTHNGSVKARYYEPKDAGETPLMLYFHGGGFICCDVDTHDSICVFLALSSGARIVSVDYRLAPETPFPGQLEDARAACAWALERAGDFGATPGVIAVAGDSAGAYLAGQTALELNAVAPERAALQVLLYPLVHLQDSLWAEEELRNFRFLGRVASKYIAKALGTETMPSLLDEPLEAAPPTIIAGGAVMDPVRRDAQALATALRTAGVKVVEREYGMLVHGGFNFSTYLDSPREALMEVGALIRAAFEGRAWDVDQTSSPSQ